MPEAVEEHDVPPEIGEGEDWEQGREAMREGYSAFLEGEDAYACPYQQSGGAGSKGWSGYKKRKLKLWDAGFILAAIREGDYGSPEEVQEDYDVGRHALPTSPTKAVYEGMSEERYLEDRGEYLYYARGVDYFETRHDAIADAATKEDSMGTATPLKRTQWVETFTRVRRPQLDTDYTDARKI